MQSLYLLALCVSSAFAVLNDRFEAGGLDSRTTQFSGYDYNVPAQKQLSHATNSEKSYTNGYHYHGPAHKYLPPAPTTTAATFGSNSLPQKYLLPTASTSDHQHNRYGANTDPNQEHFPPTTKPTGYQYRRFEVTTQPSLIYPTQTTRSSGYRRPETNSAPQQKYLQPSVGQSGYQYRRPEMNNAPQQKYLPPTSSQAGYQYKRPETNSQSTQNYFLPTERPSGYQYRRPESSSPTKRPYVSQYGTQRTETTSEPPQTYLPPTSSNAQQQREQHAQTYLPPNAAANDYRQQQSKYEQPNQSYLPPAPATTAAFYNNLAKAQDNGYQYQRPALANKRPQNNVPPAKTEAIFSNAPPLGNEQYQPPRQSNFNAQFNAYKRQQQELATQSQQQQQPQQQQQQQQPGKDSNTNGYRYEKPQQSYLPPTSRPASSIGLNIAQPEIQNAEQYLPPTLIPTANQYQQLDNSKDMGYNYKPPQPANKYLPPAQHESNKYLAPEQQNTWHQQPNTHASSAITYNDYKRTQFGAQHNRLMDTGFKRFGAGSEQRRPTGHATIERVPSLNSNGEANSVSANAAQFPNDSSQESFRTQAHYVPPAYAANANPSHADNNNNEQRTNSYRLMGSALSERLHNFASTTTTAGNNNNNNNNNNDNSFNGYSYNIPHAQSTNSVGNILRSLSASKKAQDAAARPVPGPTSNQASSHAVNAIEASVEHTAAQNALNAATPTASSNAFSPTEVSTQSQRPFHADTKSPTNTFSFDGSSTQKQYPPVPEPNYGIPESNAAAAINVPSTNPEHEGAFAPVGLWAPATTILQQVQSDSFELQPYFTIEREQPIAQQNTLPDVQMPPSQTLFNLEAPRQPHAVYGSPAGTPQSAAQQPSIRSTKSYLPPSRDFQPPHYY